MKKTYLYLAAAALALPLASCSDDEITDDVIDGDIDVEAGVEMPEWYYTGGQLGTAYLATSNCFEQPTPAVEQGGFYQSFKNGEVLFEKPFMENLSGDRCGLGPVYIRTSCMHCHPGYSHGERVPAGTFATRDPGNGCLLVVYNPATDAYVTWLAGMPQTHAVEPFKAPIDESQIQIAWLEATDQWGNAFDDGETYSLQYPQVTIPESAFYIKTLGDQIGQPFDLGTYEVRLESTIGIYGSGLLDAISDDDLREQYLAEQQWVNAGYLPNGLNASIWGGSDWASQYSNTRQGDGTMYAKRFTYALSRGPLVDGAGANAIWNITNVTRSDRRYHYLDLNGTIYASYSSLDPDVQAGFDAYIAKVDPNKEHSEWWDGAMNDRIYNYLLSTDLPVEMTDDEYTDLVVWHRGLAVPAARNVTDSEVLQGKELFTEIGCATCHRPSWTTGPDNISDPAKFFTNNSQLPRYPYQTIWPYSDMVQHKLMMANDIRTGWCRTTPLWGRGLHKRATGSSYDDRLHDCRARTITEAIMWHGWSQQSDAYQTILKYRSLTKAERDAICKFIESI